MLTLALAALIAAVPESVPVLALDVANPRKTGRHILHFEDVIGPRAQKIARPVRGLLVVALAPGRRQPTGTQLDTLADATPALVALGALVVGVVLPGPTPADDPAIEPEAMPFVVAFDRFGLATRRLGLLGPGHVLVIRSDGRIAGSFGPDPRALGDAVATLTALLKEEQP